MLSLRYWDSDNGERRDIAPVCDVMRISCSGMVASAASSIASGDAGSSAVDVVRGRSVMVVGRCPPSEKEVR